MRLKYLKVVLNIIYMSDETKYTCKKCNFTTSHRTSFYRHKSSNKHTGKQSNKPGPKVRNSATPTSSCSSKVGHVVNSKNYKIPYQNDHVGNSGIDFSDMLVNK